MSGGYNVLGGKCPEGKCPGGKFPGGMCPWGKCPGGGGGGGSVLSPYRLHRSISNRTRHGHFVRQCIQIKTSAIRMFPTLLS